MDIRKISLSDVRSIRREVLKPGTPEPEVSYPGDDSESAQHLGAFEGDRLIGVATFLPERAGLAQAPLAAHRFPCYVRRQESRP